MAISNIGGAGASSAAASGAGTWGGLGVIAGGYSSTGQVTIASPRKGQYWLSHADGTSSRMVIELGGSSNVVNTNFFATQGNIYQYNQSGSGYNALSTPTSISVYGYWAKTSTPQACYATAYGAGVYVMGDGSGNMYSSPDAITWTSRGNIGAVYVRSIFWNGSLFIATGSNAGLGTGVLYTSTDGLTWTSRTTPSSSNFDVTFGAGLAIVASNGGIYSSPDYVTWTNRSATNVQAVAHNGLTGGTSMFVAVNNGGNIFSSSDGITWTSRTNPAGQGMNSVVYGGGVWVAVGQSGAIVSSTDGITWTTRATATIMPNTTFNFFSVAYGSGRFVAASSGLMSGDVGGGFYASTDGIVWRPVGGTAVVAQTLFPRYLTYTNSRFLCANQSASLSYSADGLACNSSSFTLMSSAYQVIN